jgi:hypothetical protein
MSLSPAVREDWLELSDDAEGAPFDKLESAVDNPPLD